jgi:hypothetical protein
VFEGKKTKDVPLNKFLEHACIAGDLQTFTAVDFTNEENPRVFPIWRGHTHPLVPEVNMDLIQPFLDHVKNVICSGNEEYYDTEIKKDAWMFQHPLYHMGWATVLIGEEGTEKGMYTNVLCDLWGPEYSQRNVNSMEQVTGDKSMSTLRNQKLVVCNELSRTESKAGKNVNWDIMKSRITDDVVRARAMYQEYSRPFRNTVNYIFSSNHMDSIYMSEGARRYFCLRVSSEHSRDTEYFGPLVRQWSTPEFKSHLLTYLLRLDTTGLNVNDPPDTDLKVEIVSAGMSHAEMFIRRPESWVPDEHVMLDRTELLIVPDRPDLKVLESIRFAVLWARFVSWLDEQGIDSGRYAGNPNQFYAKVNRWVNKTKSNTMWYQPNAALLRLWSQEKE